MRNQMDNIVTNVLKDKGYKNFIIGMLDETRTITAEKILSFRSQVQIKIDLITCEIYFTQRTQDIPFENYVEHLELLLECKETAEQIKEIICYGDNIMR